jgi:hypothetical protein
MPGHDCIRFARTLPEGRFFQVKPQVSLAHLRIRTVATEAVAGQDWLYILVEVEVSPGLRPTRMPGVAAHGCRQQGHRYYRGWQFLQGQGAVSVLSATERGRTPNASLGSQRLSTLTSRPYLRNGSRFLVCLQLIDNKISSARRPRQTRPRAGQVPGAYHPYVGRLLCDRIIRVNYGQSS